MTIIKVEGVENVVAELLARQYKAYDLKQICKRYDFFLGQTVGDEIVTAVKKDKSYTL